MLKVLCICCATSKMSWYQLSPNCWLSVGCLWIAVLKTFSQGGVVLHSYWLMHGQNNLWCSMTILRALISSDFADFLWLEVSLDHGRKMAQNEMSKKFTIFTQIKNFANNLSVNYLNSSLWDSFKISIF